MGDLTRKSKKDKKKKMNSVSTDTHKHLTIGGIALEVYKHLDDLGINVHYERGVSMYGDTFYQVNSITLPRKFTEQEEKELKDFLAEHTHEANRLLYNIKSWESRHCAEYSGFDSPVVIEDILRAFSYPNRLEIKQEKECQLKIPNESSSANGSIVAEEARETEERQKVKRE